MLNPTKNKGGFPMLRKISSLLLALVMLLGGTALAEVTPNGEFPVVDTPTEISVQRHYQIL